jgi:uncharacterized protein
MDMRIARDGTWFHEGTPIGRPGLVALFASILKREGDAYFLVSPVEKVGITVEDAPFVAVDFEVTPEGLTFVTNLGDRVLAGPEHPIRVVRDGRYGRACALCARPVQSGGADRPQVVLPACRSGRNGGP